ncbi:1-deoxy-D-xylulose-5-phosphate synthase [Peptococcaceae bacterium SCADC1_2_3]|nr:1-deoxy-D-xylulose-5-phosphate synthase [Peptococcaceae bacterium SCADC1_2_3]KFI37312.1 1-deoxy-D-xylulose-5-phosphate synthase [Peptococcaceae bacterium SCADC1_2_3]
MDKLLPLINSPEDIKRLNLIQLQQLVQEIRQEIIDTVAQNGGHLASNLGVAELTLALHYVFNTPADKIVWDVGHQCYTHKLLTGRRTKFHTLRKFGGLNGFPSPEESLYDIFATGHSSTSISAALGLALARDLNQETFHVIAVIGDGALTGGMAFEALNHAGHLQTRLIIILNDNEMSIAPNVGALSGYLSRLRADPKYLRRKEEIEQILRKLPAIGPKMVKIGERLKESIKHLMVPGKFFEELGFTYFGPIDGHNLEELISLFQKIQTIKKPVLIHLITRKGKGYLPAETNADKFHGVGPLELTGKKPDRKNNPVSYTEVFGRTLVDLAQEKKEIVAVTAAMASGTGLNYFAQAFPGRLFDVGIAEQHAVTLSAGLATGGLKPVVAIYSTFLQRAYDQILIDVCSQKLPVTFAVDRGGLVGEDGATHHGIFDYTYLRSMPNMIVMAPADEDELRHMLKTALEYPGPAALRYPRGPGQGKPMLGKPVNLTIGKAKVLREGDDLTLLAAGSMVLVATEAANNLAKLGIEAAVINARFIKPLDEETILAYALKTKKIITIEENILAGGFGAAVLELLTIKNLFNISVKCLGLPVQFIPHGNRETLLSFCGLTADQVVVTARSLLNYSGQLKASPSYSQGRF